MRFATLDAVTWGQGLALEQLYHYLKRWEDSPEDYESDPEFLCRQDRYRALALLPPRNRTASEREELRGLAIWLRDRTQVKRTLLGRTMCAAAIWKGWFDPCMEVAKALCGRPGPTLAHLR